MTENMTSNRPTDADPRDSTAPPPHGRGSRTLFMLMVVAGVIVLLVGAAIAAMSGFARGGGDTQTLTEIVNRIEVRTDTGDIEVRAAEPGAPTTVTTKTRSIGEAPSTHIAVVDGSLQVTGECSARPFMNTCETNFVITAPPGAVVQAVAETGDVIIDNLTGAVSASSQTGNITARNVSGELALASTTGDVVGSGLTTQRVSARTDVGDVRLTFTATPQQVSGITNTGDVEIAVPKDGIEYRTNATTENGRVTVAVPVWTRSTRSLLSHSDMGDVSIRTAG